MKIYKHIKLLYIYILKFEISKLNDLQLRHKNQINPIFKDKKSQITLLFIQKNNFYLPIKRKTFFWIINIEKT